MSCNTHWPDLKVAAHILGIARQPALVLYSKYRELPMLSLIHAMINPTHNKMYTTGLLSG